MAKFTDYTQKTKPADADLLLIHDNAGAANKKTPFSGVWSWILDKLASAVISQLETTNKSIIPAINELNSKTQSFYTEGSESTSAIPVKSANKYFCVAAQQGEGGLSNTAIVFVLEISNDFKKANIAKIFATALSVSVKLNDGAVTFTFGSSYIKLLMINIDHA